jgi:hypothetical protein
MKLWHVILRAVLCLILQASMQGCQLSQSQKYSVSSQAYNATTATVESLSRSNLITLPILERFEIARELTEKMLDDFEQAIREGRKFETLDLLESLLEQMAEWSQPQPIPPLSYMRRIEYFDCDGVSKPNMQKSFLEMLFGRTISQRSNYASPTYTPRNSGSALVSRPSS